MTTNRRTLFLTPEEYDRLKATYPKFNEPWQADEEEELKSMAADKVPLKEMSAQLGRTTNSLQMRIFLSTCTMRGSLLKRCPISSAGHKGPSFPAS